VKAACNGTEIMYRTLIICQKSNAPIKVDYPKNMPTTKKIPA
jgi:hypothetical protein